MKTPISFIVNNNAELRPLLQHLEENNILWCDGDKATEFEHPSGEFFFPIKIKLVKIPAWKNDYYIIWCEMKECGTCGKICENNTRTCAYFRQLKLERLKNG